METVYMTVYFRIEELEAYVQPNHSHSCHTRHHGIASSGLNVEKWQKPSVKLFAAH